MLRGENRTNDETLRARPVATDEAGGKKRRYSPWRNVDMGRAGGPKIYCESGRLRSVLSLRFFGD